MFATGVDGGGEKAPMFLVSCSFNFLSNRKRNSLPATSSFRHANATELAADRPTDMDNHKFCFTRYSHFASSE